MKLNNYECSIFLNQLSLIVTSGLSLLEGLDSIIEEKSEYNNIFINVRKSLESGHSLSEALSESRAFDNYLVNMIKIGEECGYLDSTLKHLSVYYARIDRMQHELKSNMTYPTILLIMMIGVLLLLVTKVLPIFQTVLNNMGVELNAGTILLMDIGSFLANYGLGILILVFFMSAIYYLFHYLKYKELTLNVILENNILTRKLVNEIAVSKFVYALSLLINSGVAIDNILEIASSLTSNKFVLNRLKNANGNDFVNKIVSTDLLKPIYSRMLKLGYKAGKLDETINEIALGYENEVNNSVNKFLNVIEPSMVFICCIIVGIILLSVMLPLMSIMVSL